MNLSIVTKLLLAGDTRSQDTRCDKPGFKECNDVPGGGGKSILISFLTLWQKYSKIIKKAILNDQGRCPGAYLGRAINATELYHNTIKELLNKGEHAEEIAMDVARFVDSFADIQPFKIMYDFCKILIKNSLQNGKSDHFIIWCRLKGHL